MVSETIETTGKLSRPDLMKQKALVYKLGEQVLENASAIEFIRTEPSYEEFQAMRLRLTS